MVIKPALQKGKYRQFCPRVNLHGMYVVKVSNIVEESSLVTVCFVEE